MSLKGTDLVWFLSLSYRACAFGKFNHAIKQTKEQPLRMFQYFSLRLPDCRQPTYTVTEVHSH
eukprot:4519586-Amphidinium_carterae.1